MINSLFTQKIEIKTLKKLEIVTLAKSYFDINKHNAISQNEDKETESRIEQENDLFS